MYILYYDGDPEARHILCSQHDDEKEIRTIGHVEYRVLEGAIRAFKSLIELETFDVPNKEELILKVARIKDINAKIKFDWVSDAKYLGTCGDAVTGMLHVYIRALSIITFDEVCDVLPDDYSDIEVDYETLETLFKCH